MSSGNDVADDELGDGKEELSAESRDGILTTITVLLSESGIPGCVLAILRNRWREARNKTQFTT